MKAKGKYPLHALDAIALESKITNWILSFRKNDEHELLMLQPKLK